MTFIIPAVGSPLEKALVASDLRDVLTTGWTFSGLNFGTEYADRYLVAVAAANATSSDISSCTIGGVTATKLAGNTAIRRVSIWGALVPTGTSGTVVLAASVTSAGAGLHLYSFYPMPPVNTATLTTDGGSITVPSAGFAIGGVMDSRGGSFPSAGFSSGLTADAGVSFGASGLFARLTSGSVAGTGASVTVSATGSTGGPYGFAVAAFGA
jgi:hypothetical protein